MEVIVPCAGLSSRFPGVRPKYLLTDYKGEMMIENAVKNYVGLHNITVVILKEHDDMYDARSKLNSVFGDKVDVVVLDARTKGPAETVYQTLKIKNIDENASLLIKDCDGFYSSNEETGNVIYIAKLSKYPNTRTAAAKSYTVTNEQGVISTVVEKQIVSDSFCVGGYQFGSVKSFVKSYEEIVHDGEIFVSHVIDHMISRDHVFIESEVKDFIDVGVIDDWFEYNNRPTYFCDIDGTIIKTKFDYNDVPEPIVDNVLVLLEEMNRGCKIVFVTARPKKYEEITRNILNNLGFHRYELLMNIHHTKRVLINDFAKTNPYPSAVAINLKRDDNNLRDYI